MHNPILWLVGRFASWRYARLISARCSMSSHAEKLQKRGEWWWQVYQRCERGRP